MSRWQAVMLLMVFAGSAPAQSNSAPGAGPNSAGQSAAGAVEEAQRALTMRIESLLAECRQDAFARLPGAESRYKRVMEARPRQQSWEFIDHLYTSDFRLAPGATREEVFDGLLRASIVDPAKGPEPSDGLDRWCERMLDRPAGQIDPRNGKVIYPAAYPEAQTLFLNDCADAAIHQEMLAADLDMPGFVPERLAHLQRAAAYWQHCRTLLDAQKAVNPALVKFWEVPENKQLFIASPSGNDRMRELVPGVYLAVLPRNHGSAETRVLVHGDVVQLATPETALTAIADSIDTTRQYSGIGNNSIELMVDRALVAVEGSAWRVESAADIPAMKKPGSVPAEVVQKIGPLTRKAGHIQCFIYTPLHGVVSEWNFDLTENMENSKPKVHHPEVSHISVTQLAQQVGDARNPKD